MTGVKVFPVPEVVVSPIPQPVPDGLSKCHPGVFVADVLT